MRRRWEPVFPQSLDPQSLDPPSLDPPSLDPPSSSVSYQHWWTGLPSSSPLAEEALLVNCLAAGLAALGLLLPVLLWTERWRGRSS